MSTRAIGPQDNCTQCGESKTTIRTSQRKGGLDVLFCAVVDYWGETEAEWPRHKFTWTQADVDSLSAEDAYWEAVAATLTAKSWTAA